MRHYTLAACCRDTRTYEIEIFGHAWHHGNNFRNWGRHCLAEYSILLVSILCETGPFVRCNYTPVLATLVNLMLSVISENLKIFHQHVSSSLPGQVHHCFVLLKRIHLKRQWYWWKTHQNLMQWFQALAMDIQRLSNRCNARIGKTQFD